ncbi:MAG: right-handed parallel beta-helix repeat-containing protein [Alphaproteobacteria bacterium]
MILLRAGVLAACILWAIQALAGSPAEDAARRIAAAHPGDVITLAPGDYDLASTWRLATAGSPGRPIVLRAERLGDVRIASRAVQALVIEAPYWIVENLDIRGACDSDGDCEHAIHLVGDADHAIIRNNRLHDFNAAIKGNGKDKSTGRVFPDDVTIAGNRIYNRSVRATTAPVALIDVVGGSTWRISDNVIADFGKSQGNGIAHGAFLKGNSSDGVFERNLVACAWRHDGGARIGLSFGGGGVTDARYCENQDCSRMHRRGIMRNNIILNCSDVGVYLNRASETGVFNNLLFDTAGLDVRFGESSADIRNNIIFGAIRNRDGGTSSASRNLPAGPWYVDPAGGDFTPKDGRMLGRGDPLPRVTDDHCGHPRPAERPDIGPFQYDHGPCPVIERLKTLEEN